MLKDVATASVTVHVTLALVSKAVVERLVGGAKGAVDTAGHWKPSPSVFTAETEIA
jgi:hypothetical protein